MSISLQHCEASTEIRLEGAIDISCAEDLKRALVEALCPEKEILILLDGVTSLDVAAVQLLWAAAREARAAGRGFGYAGAPAEDVVAALAEAGLPLSLQTDIAKELSEVAG